MTILKNKYSIWRIFFGDSPKFNAIIWTISTLAVAVWIGSIGYKIDKLIQFGHLLVVIFPLFSIFTQLIVIPYYTSLRNVRKIIDKRLDQVP